MSLHVPCCAGGGLDEIVWSRAPSDAAALVAEAAARLLPLALSAPHVAVLHAVHLAALLVVGARAPARRAGGSAPAAAAAAAHACQPHVLLCNKQQTHLTFADTVAVSGALLYCGAIPRTSLFRGSLFHQHQPI